MVNFREVLRRFIKYALMMVIVTLASVNITSKNINNMEAISIGIIAATIYAVLDMVVPTICIKHKEQ